MGVENISRREFLQRIGRGAVTVGLSALLRESGFDDREYYQALQEYRYHCLANVTHIEVSKSLGRTAVDQEALKVFAEAAVGYFVKTGVTSVAEGPQEIRFRNYDGLMLGAFANYWPLKTGRYEIFMAEAFRNPQSPFYSSPWALSLLVHEIAHGVGVITRGQSTLDEFSSQIMTTEVLASMVNDKIPDAEASLVAHLSLMMNMGMLYDSYFHNDELGYRNKIGTLVAQPSPSLNLGIAVYNDYFLSHKRQFVRGASYYYARPSETLFSALKLGELPAGTLLIPDRARKDLPFNLRETQKYFDNNGLPFN